MLKPFLRLNLGTNVWMHSVTSIDPNDCVDSQGNTYPNLKAEFVFGLCSSAFPSSSSSDKSENFFKRFEDEILGNYFI